MAFQIIKILSTHGTILKIFLWIRYFNLIILVFQILYLGPQQLHLIRQRPDQSGLKSSNIILGGIEDNNWLYKKKT